MKSTKVTKTISNMIETKVKDIQGAVNVFVDMTYGMPSDDKEKREKIQLKIDLMTEYLNQTSKTEVVPEVKAIASIHTISKAVEDSKVENQIAA